MDRDSSLKIKDNLVMIDYISVEQTSHLYCTAMKAGLMYTECSVTSL